MNNIFLKNALIEASKWEEQLSIEERNTLTYNKAREVVLDRIFEKYSKLINEENKKN